MIGAGTAMAERRHSDVKMNDVSLPFFTNTKPKYPVLPSSTGDVILRQLGRTNPKINQNQHDQKKSFLDLAKKFGKHLNNN